MSNTNELNKKLGVFATMPMAQRRAFGLGVCLRKRNEAHANDDFSTFHSAMVASGVSEKDFERAPHGVYKLTAVEAAWSGWLGEPLSASDLIRAMASLHKRSLLTLDQADWCVIDFFMTHGRLFDVAISMGSAFSPWGSDEDKQNEWAHSNLMGQSFDPKIFVLLGGKGADLGAPGPAGSSDAPGPVGAPSLEILKTQACSPAQLQAAIVELIELHNKMAAQVKSRLPTRNDVINSSTYGF